MRRTLTLSLAGGLLGGALSGFFHPLNSHAQSQPPEEIRAQRFTLVNEQGTILGSFSFDGQGRPEIVLRDRFGHEVWSVVGEHATTSSHLERK